MARPPRWLVTTESQKFGSGWLSGTIAAVLGIAAASTAFSMASPQWLSLPELRSLLQGPAAIRSVQAATVIACVLGVLSLALRRTKTLGVVALVTSTIAVLCLQFVDGDPSTHAEQPLGFGLDVFALTLILYTHQHTLLNNYVRIRKVYYFIALISYCNTRNDHIKLTICKCRENTIPSCCNPIRSTIYSLTNFRHNIDIKTFYYTILNKLMWRISCIRTNV